MTGSLFSIEWGIEIEKKGDSVPLFEQVHGNEILHLPKAGELEMASKALPQADGAIAHFNQAEVHVYTADCLPILFFTEDPNGPIAAIHAGWKGVKKGIVHKAYQELSHFKNLHVLIGPAIGVCCFAVREDFIQEWETANLSPRTFLSRKNNRDYFNLLNYVTQEALSELPPSHLHLDWFRCTVCSTPSLPSFRRNKSANPRLRTWIRKTA
jgi:YfiH family protein